MRLMIPQQTLWESEHIEGFGSFGSRKVFAAQAVQKLGTDTCPKFVCNQQQESVPTFPPIDLNSVRRPPFRTSFTHFVAAFDLYSCALVTQPGLRVAKAEATLAYHGRKKLELSSDGYKSALPFPTSQMHPATTSELPTIWTTAGKTVNALALFLPPYHCSYLHLTTSVRQKWFKPSGCWQVPDDYLSTIAAYLHTTAAISLPSTSLSLQPIFTLPRLLLAWTVTRCGALHPRLFDLCSAGARHAIITAPSCCGRIFIPTHGHELHRATTHYGSRLQVYPQSWLLHVSIWDTLCLSDQQRRGYHLEFEIGLCDVPEALCVLRWSRSSFRWRAPWISTGRRHCHWL